MRSPGQIALEFASDSAFSRDDLVVGAANSAAITFLDGWRQTPPHVVVLAGPTGAGKTHLASIWREEAGATPLDPARLAQTDPQQPILIDDADTGQIDEAALFHLLNAARSRGMPVLLTAKRFPSAWGIRLPDLLSRLNAATVIELGEPDDSLLAAVIGKLFADRQVAVEPATVDFLVRRIERSIAAAIEVVERLDRRALETKSRITRQLAASVLEAMQDGGRPAGL